jgi:hypothetical protein
MYKIVPRHRLLDLVLAWAAARGVDLDWFNNSDTNPEEWCVGLTDPADEIRHGNSFRKCIVYGHWMMRASKTDWARERVPNNPDLRPYEETNWPEHYAYRKDRFLELFPELSGFDFSC